jgi:predicted O-linked N-acetylglucosamine transferase (SPINDLY family)
MASNHPLLARATHYWRQRDYRKAERALGQFMRASPDDSEGPFLLGTLLCEEGRLAAGIRLLASAAALAPGRSDVLINLGAAQQRLGELGLAADAFVAARKLLSQPRAELDYNLGIVYQQQGQPSAAIDAFSAALAAAPGWAAAWTSLAHNLMTVGQVSSALEAYDRAKTLAPSDAQAWSNWCWASNYDESLDDAGLAERHRQFGAHFEGDTPVTISLRSSRRSEKRLRVGWLSPNLADHAVAYFIKALFENYDRSRFQFIAYALGPVDAVTKALTAKLDGSRGAHGMALPQLRRLIEDDEIDVLIDLAGHTAHNGLAVLIPPLAPVQASYLGYPTTTGLAAMDYLISDALLDPSDGFPYAETVVRLPLFCCYSPPVDAPDPSPLPAFNKGHLTFGSFQNFAKLSPETLTRWARLLREIPGAHLLIQGAAGGDVPTVKRLAAVFSNLGVDPDGIAFRPFTGMNDYLAAHAEVDICLDTTPWNGHTTTCHALWQGVPTLSMSTGRRSGRMGLAIMTALGLADQFVADDDDGFIALGKAHAEALPALAELRQGLRQRLGQSALCDGARFAQAFGQCLEKMAV